MTAETSAPVAKNEDSARGFAFAMTAYTLWGFLPFYMKAVAHISPMEVIAHRVLWSLPVAGIVLLLLGRTDQLKSALRSPRTILMAALTATLITLNWGIYIWAIAVGRTLDAALGYFINPLFSIFLGAVLLKEKLKPAQVAAIGLASIAVAILTYDAGTLPWVSLGLMLTWAFYAFFRKTLPVGPNQGFFLEVLMLSIPCLIYVVYIEAAGTGHLLNSDWSDTALLVGCGIVTAAPLMIYGNGAKLLKLSTIGIMQYIAPTIIFLIAVFVFGEPFGTTKLIAFLFIWSALIVYSWSMLRQSQGH